MRQLPQAAGVLLEGIYARETRNSDERRCWKFPSVVVIHPSTALAPRCIVLVFRLNSRVLYCVN